MQLSSLSCREYLNANEEAVVRLKCRMLGGFYKLKVHFM